MGVVVKAKVFIVQNGPVLLAADAAALARTLCAPGLINYLLTPSCWLLLVCRRWERRVGGTKREVEQVKLLQFINSIIINRIIRIIIFIFPVIISITQHPLLAN